MVNPYTNVTMHEAFLDNENAMDMLVNHDVICDALDTMSARILMQNTASKLGIPVVHGAIAGWYGQVATLFPGDKIPGSLIRQKLDYGLERTLGNVAFTAGLVASIQVSEVVKLLLRKGEILRNRLMIVDTLRNDIEVFSGDF
jgi:molybdopterin/thiamine biosynthesis adenylyltransferase